MSPVKKAIVDFANNLSLLGIHPYRVAHKNYIPDDLHKRFQYLLKMIKDNIEEFDELEQKNIYNNSPYNHLISELVRLFVENDSIEQIYQNCNYKVIEQKNKLHSALPLENMDEEQLIEMDKKSNFIEMYNKNIADPNVIPYGIKIGNYVALFHRYFRGLCDKFSYYNDELIMALNHANKNNKVKLKMAFDPDMLAYFDSYCEIILLERYYGPTYTNEIWDKKTGEPMQIRYDKKFENLIRKCSQMYENRTEFYWTYKNDTKMLQIEEIHSAQLQPKEKDKILTRYLHVERDTNSGIFKHLDGAIKIYNTEDFEKRLDNTMPNSRKTNKIKIFRLDGEIPFKDFMQITATFFKKNYQVLEYFNWKDNVG